MAAAILVPVDGSPMAEQALAFVAEEYDDAPVHLLYVVDHVESSHDLDWTSLPVHIDDWTQQVSRRCEELLADARETATADGLEVVASQVVAGRPVTGIVDYADDHEIDHIVMGSHGRSGLSRFILGSVAEQVLRRSTVPVTIVR